MVTRNTYCAARGWSETQSDEPDITKCPICGRPTLRRVLFWEAQREDLLKILKFVLAVGSIGSFWFWLTFPYGPDGTAHQPVAYVNVRLANVSDTPRGVVARFLVENESNHHLAKLTLEIKFHGQSRAAGQEGQSKGQYTKDLTDLASKSEIQFEVELGEGKAADVFGWNARVTSFALPPGYWNRRMQQAISVRVIGQSQTGPTVPTPFDDAWPKR